MKKAAPSPKENPATKKGYNEKNPGQPQGAFPPDAHQQKTSGGKAKSNAADKKVKEEEEKK